jgi:hypothetical protein
MVLGGQYTVLELTLSPISVYDIVTCIAREWTCKHLATEYMHTTIELLMLLLGARQQSAHQ